MKVAIQLPDQIGQQLRGQWGDLELHALEALAAQAYRLRLLTHFQVRELLGHQTRWQTEEMLGRHGADIGYGASDVSADLATLQSFSKAP